MKKIANFHSMLTLLVAIMLGLCISSCGNDDDSDIDDIYPTGDINSAVVGTWKGHWGYSDDYLWDEKITFKKNGTFERINDYNDIRHPEDSFYHVESGRWSASEDVITFVTLKYSGFKESDDMYPGKVKQEGYTVKGDILTLYDLKTGGDNKYIRQ